MSKLQELIDRLCPDGVEYTTLGNIAEIKRGVRVVKSDLAIEGSIPVYQNSLTPLGYYSKSNFNADTTFVIGAGAAGEIGYSAIPYWGADDCYSIICSSKIISKYVFYQLSNNQIFLKSRVRTASIPRMARTAIEQFPIPVPPIEVQGEIVKILDRFADYAAELQAELQARRLQYEYYRNLLLTFNPSAYGCGTDDAQKISVIARGGHSYEIQWKTMGEICYSLNTGLNPRQFFKLNTPDATGYYVTIREIRGGRIMFNDNTDRINNEGLKLCNNRSNLEKGDVLFSGTGTIGQVAVITETPTNWNIKEGVYSIKPNQELVSSFFLRYILESRDIKDAIMKKVAGGTVKSIPMAELKNILIPIPPLELQEKIVSVLDRFETLVNDLSKGLPAEIEAVKARYEYYRNKLLTFNPLSA